MQMHFKEKHRMLQLTLVVSALLINVIQAHPQNSAIANWFAKKSNDFEKAELIKNNEVGIVTECQYIILFICSVYYAPRDKRNKIKKSNKQGNLREDVVSCFTRGDVRIDEKSRREAVAYYSLFGPGMHSI